MTDPWIEAFGARVPIAETLGGEILERGEGRAVLRYPVKPEYSNPLGQLQGGMYAVMLDSAMAAAAGVGSAVTPDSSDTRFTTPVTSSCFSLLDNKLGDMSGTPRRRSLK